MAQHPIRILLIDPGNSRGEINEPIGIAALTAELEAQLGPGVRVEQRFVPFDGPVVPNSLSHYDLVGLTTPLGSLAEIAWLHQRWSEHRVQDRPLLVLGGLLATFAPEDVLARFPGAICVVGEGEEAIVELVSALAEVGPSRAVQAAVERNVPNLVAEIAGQTIHTSRRNIEMDRTHAPLRSYVGRIAAEGGIVRAEASRGCAWGKCRFCAIQHKYCGEARWRPVPVERIVDELAQLSQLGARHPYYTDEDFVGTDPGRAVELARAISEAKLQGRIAPDLSLYLDMRVDSLLAPSRRGQPSGEQVLDALIAAGLREVFVGVESGAKEQVKRYQKAATAGRNQRVLELLGDKGISADVGFIMFDPEMAFDEIRVNLDFLRETGLWSHDSRLTKELRLEAGTPLVEDYRAKGLISGPMDLDELCFPYRWRDPRAEEVHALFRAWEAQEQQRVYALQSATRGEVRDPAERRHRRDLLGRVRAAEHGALAAITEAISSGTTRALDLGTWSSARAQVIDTWERRVPAISAAK
jgi:hypothetical protein